VLGGRNPGCGAAGGPAAPSSEGRIPAACCLRDSPALGALAARGSALSPARWGESQAVQARASNLACSRRASTVPAACRGRGLVAARGFGGEQPLSCLTSKRADVPWGLVAAVTTCHSALGVGGCVARVVAGAGTGWRVWRLR